MTSLIAAVRAWPLVRKIGFGLILAVAIGVAIWAVRESISAGHKASEAKGAATERADTQAKVITNVQKANDAAAAIRSDPGAAHDICVRHSRTPENCR